MSVSGDLSGGDFKRDPNLSKDQAEKKQDFQEKPPVVKEPEVDFSKLELPAEGEAKRGKAGDQLVLPAAQPVSIAQKAKKVTAYYETFTSVAASAEISDLKAISNVGLIERLKGVTSPMKRMRLLHKWGLTDPKSAEARKVAEVVGRMERRIKDLEVAREKYNSISLQKHFWSHRRIMPFSEVFDSMHRGIGNWFYKQTSKVLGFFGFKRGLGQTILEDYIHSVSGQSDRIKKIEESIIDVEKDLAGIRNIIGIPKELEELHALLRSQRTSLAVEKDPASIKDIEEKIKKTEADIKDKEATLTVPKELKDRYLKLQELKNSLQTEMDITKNKLALGKSLAIKGFEHLGKSIDAKRKGLHDVALQELVKAKDKLNALEAKKAESVTDAMKESIEKGFIAPLKAAITEARRDFKLEELTSSQQRLLQNVRTLKKSGGDLSALFVPNPETGVSQLAGLLNVLKTQLIFSDDIRKEQHTTLKEIAFIEKALRQPIGGTVHENVKAYVNKIKPLFKTKEEREKKLKDLFDRKDELFKYEGVNVEFYELATELQQLKESFSDPRDLNVKAIEEIQSQVAKRVLDAIDEIEAALKLEDKNIFRHLNELLPLLKILEKIQLRAFPSFEKVLADIAGQPNKIFDAVLADINGSLIGIEIPPKSFQKSSYGLVQADRKIRQFEQWMQQYEVSFPQHKSYSEDIKSKIGELRKILEASKAKFTAEIAIQDDALPKLLKLRTQFIFSSDKEERQKISKELATLDLSPIKDSLLARDLFNQAFDTEVEFQVKAEEEPIKKRTEGEVFALLFQQINTLNAQTNVQFDKRFKDVMTAVDILENKYMDFEQRLKTVRPTIDDPFIRQLIDKELGLLAAPRKKMLEVDKAKLQQLAQTAQTTVESVRTDLAEMIDNRENDKTYFQSRAKLEAHFNKLCELLPLAEGQELVQSAIKGAVRVLGVELCLLIPQEALKGPASLYGEWPKGLADPRKIVSYTAQTQAIANSLAKQLNETSEYGLYGFKGAKSRLDFVSLIGNTHRATTMIVEARLKLERFDEFLNKLKQSGFHFTEKGLRGEEIEETVELVNWSALFKKEHKLENVFQKLKDDLQECGKESGIFDLDWGYPHIKQQELYLLQDLTRCGSRRDVESIVDPKEAVERFANLFDRLESRALADKDIREISARRDEELAQIHFLKRQLAVYTPEIYRKVLAKRENSLIAEAFDRQYHTESIICHLLSTNKKLWEQQTTDPELAAAQLLSRAEQIVVPDTPRHALSRGEQEPDYSRFVRAEEQLLSLGSRQTAISNNSKADLKKWFGLGGKIATNAAFKQARVLNEQEEAAVKELDDPTRAVGPLQVRAQTNIGIVKKLGFPLLYPGNKVPEAEDFNYFFDLLGDRDLFAKVYEDPVAKNVLDRLLMKYPEIVLETPRHLWPQQTQEAFNHFTNQYLLVRQDILKLQMGDKPDTQKATVLGEQLERLEAIIPKLVQKAKDDEVNYPSFKAQNANTLKTIFPQGKFIPAGYIFLNVLSQFDKAVADLKQAQAAHRPDDAEWDKVHELFGKIEQMYPDYLEGPTRVRLIASLQPLVTPGVIQEKPSARAQKIIEHAENFTPQPKVLLERLQAIMQQQIPAPEDIVRAEEMFARLEEIAENDPKSITGLGHQVVLGHLEPLKKYLNGWQRAEALLKQLGIAVPVQEAAPFVPREQESKRNAAGSAAVDQQAPQSKQDLEELISANLKNITNPKNNEEFARLVVETRKWIDNFFKISGDAEATKAFENALDHELSDVDFIKGLKEWINSDNASIDTLKPKLDALQPMWPKLPAAQKEFVERLYLTLDNDSHLRLAKDRYEGSVQSLLRKGLKLYLRRDLGYFPFDPTANREQVEHEVIENLKQAAGLDLEQDASRDRKKIPTDPFQSVEEAYRLVQLLKGRNDYDQIVHKYNEVVHSLSLDRLTPDEKLVIENAKKGVFDDLVQLKATLGKINCILKGYVPSVGKNVLLLSLVQIESKLRALMAANPDVDLKELRSRQNLLVTVTQLIKENADIEALEKLSSMTWGDFQHEWGQLRKDVILRTLEPKDFEDKIDRFLKLLDYTNYFEILLTGTNDDTFKRVFIDYLITKGLSRVQDRELQKKVILIQGLMTLQYLAANKYQMTPAIQESLVGCMRDLNSSDPNGEVTKAFRQQVTQFFLVHNVGVSNEQEALISGMAQDLLPSQIKAFLKDKGFDANMAALSMRILELYLTDMPAIKRAEHMRQLQMISPEIFIKNPYFLIHKGLVDQLVQEAQEQVVKEARSKAGVSIDAVKNEEDAFAFLQLAQKRKIALTREDYKKLDPKLGFVKGAKIDYNKYMKLAALDYLPQVLSGKGNASAIIQYMRMKAPVGQPLTPETSREIAHLYKLVQTYFPGAIQEALEEGVEQQLKFALTSEDSNINVDLAKEAYQRIGQLIEALPKEPSLKELSNHYRGIIKEAEKAYILNTDQISEVFRSAITTYQEQIAKSPEHQLQSYTQFISELKSLASQANWERFLAKQDRDHVDQLASIIIKNLAVDIPELRETHKVIRLNVHLLPHYLHALKQTRDPAQFKLILKTLLEFREKNPDPETVKAINKQVQEHFVRMRYIDPIAIEDLKQGNLDKVPQILAAKTPEDRIEFMDRLLFVFDFYPGELAEVAKKLAPVLQQSILVDYTNENYRANLSVVLNQHSNVLKDNLKMVADPGFLELQDRLVELSKEKVSADHNKLSKIVEDRANVLKNFITDNQEKLPPTVLNFVRKQLVDALTDKIDSIWPKDFFEKIEAAAKQPEKNLVLDLSRLGRGDKDDVQAFSNTVAELVDVLEVLSKSESDPQEKISCNAKFIKYCFQLIALEYNLENRTNTLISIYTKLKPAIEVQIALLQGNVEQLNELEPLLVKVTARLNVLERDRKASAQLVEIPEQFAADLVRLKPPYNAEFRKQAIELRQKLKALENKIDERVYQRLLNEYNTAIAMINPISIELLKQYSKVESQEQEKLKKMIIEELETAWILASAVNRDELVTNIKFVFANHSELAAEWIDVDPIMNELFQEASPQRLIEAHLNKLKSEVMDSEKPETLISNAIARLAQMPYGEKYVLLAKEISDAVKRFDEFFNPEDQQNKVQGLSAKYKFQSNRIKSEFAEALNRILPQSVSFDYLKYVARTGSFNPDLVETSWKSNRDTFFGRLTSVIQYHPTFTDTERKALEGANENLRNILEQTLKSQPPVAKPVVTAPKPAEPQPATVEAETKASLAKPDVTRDMETKQKASVAFEGLGISQGAESLIRQKYEQELEKLEKLNEKAFDEKVDLLQKMILNLSVENPRLYEPIRDNFNKIIIYKLFDSSTADYLAKNNAKLPIPTSLTLEKIVLLEGYQILNPKLKEFYFQLKGLFRAPLVPEPSAYTTSSVQPEKPAAKPPVEQQPRASKEKEGFHNTLCELLKSDDVDKIMSFITPLPPSEQKEAIEALNRYVTLLAFKYGEEVTLKATTTLSIIENRIATPRTPGPVAKEEAEFEYKYFKDMQDEFDAVISNLIHKRQNKSETKDFDAIVKLLGPRRIEQRGKFLNRLTSFIEKNYHGAKKELGQQAIEVIRQALPLPISKDELIYELQYLPAGDPKINRYIDVAKAILAKLDGDEKDRMRSFLSDKILSDEERTCISLIYEFQTFDNGANVNLKRYLGKALNILTNLSREEKAKLEPLLKEQYIFLSADDRSIIKNKTLEILFKLEPKKKENLLARMRFYAENLMTEDDARTTKTEARKNVEGLIFAVESRIYVTSTDQPNSASRAPTAQASAEAGQKGKRAGAQAPASSTLPGQAEQKLADAQQTGSVETRASTGSVSTERPKIVFTENQELLRQALWDELVKDSTKRDWKTAHEIWDKLSPEERNGDSIKGIQSFLKKFEGSITRRSDAASIFPEVLKVITKFITEAPPPEPELGSRLSAYRRLSAEGPKNPEEVAKEAELLDKLTGEQQKIFKKLHSDKFQDFVEISKNQDIGSHIAEIIAQIQIKYLYGGLPNEDRKEIALELIRLESKIAAIVGNHQIDGKPLLDILFGEKNREINEFFNKALTKQVLKELNEEVDSWVAKTSKFSLAYTAALKIGTALSREEVANLKAVVGNINRTKQEVIQDLLKIGRNLEKEVPYVIAIDRRLQEQKAREDKTEALLFLIGIDGAIFSAFLNAIEKELKDMGPAKAQRVTVAEKPAEPDVKAVQAAPEGEKERFEREKKEKAAKAKVEREVLLRRNSQLEALKSLDHEKLITQGLVRTAAIFNKVSIVAKNPTEDGVNLILTSKAKKEGVTVSEARAVVIKTEEGIKITLNSTKKPKIPTPTIHFENVKIGEYILNGNLRHIHVDERAVEKPILLIFYEGTSIELTQKEFDELLSKF